jgi:glycosyltransferase involved in cell wall biosynthesis
MTENITKEKHLIILSTSYWDSPLKFRRHQWALLASRDGYKVTYVNPTFTIASFVQDKDAKHIFWNYFRKPVRVNENLQVITMPPLFPFQRKLLWVDKINRKISGWILDQKLREIRSKENVTIIVYEPNDLYRSLKIPHAVLVYECVDEHSEYPFNSRVKDKVIAIEQKLLKEADLVSVTSLFLLEKKRRFNPNHVYTPNGVNFPLFNSALKKETAIPADIEGIDGSIILYVGAIMEWFDYELVLKIAENKAWSVVLIGPQTINHHLFKDVANIHCLGVKKQHELPGYLKKADVCIIPFLINDLVKGVNPLKLYEYLAAGRPVVSTALPDVIPFKQENYVHIGRSHQEFIAHLDHLIKGKDAPDIVQARTGLAREYSWENIYRKLFDQIALFHNKRSRVGDTLASGTTRQRKRH